MELASRAVEQGARPLALAIGPHSTREMFGLALRMLRQPPMLAAALLPAELGGSWRELANKLEAFEQFRQAPTLLGLDPDASVDLAAALPRVWAWGNYPAVWAVEGLGHAVASYALTKGAGLPGPQAGLSAGVVTALHTGAALAVAERWLASTQRSNLLALPLWLGHWGEQARPAYSLLVVEALGLVTRNLAPHRVATVAGELGEHDPLLADLFWHGVGRGLYFTPCLALPWTDADGRALAEAAGEPPNEAGRRNALAGLAWARTLVNIRHPELVSGWLRDSAERIGSADAFTHGVVSALLVWRALAGRDGLLRTFLAHEPEARSHWRDWVVAPAEQALAELEAGGAPGETVLAERFRCPAGKGSGR